MAAIAGMQDFRQQGPPADIGTYLMPCSALVFRYVFAGTTYYCSVRSGERGWVPIAIGTVPETVINATFTALGAGANVVLSDATFPLVATGISFTANSQVLEGQGRGTLIDGDLLTTDNDPISIVGFTDCIIRNLAVQSVAGGGQSVYNIHIEGAADRFRIDTVWLLEADRTAIRIEASDSDIQDGWIVECWFDNCDNGGIWVDRSNGWYIDGLTIHGCKFGSSCTGFDIGVEYTRHSIISDCTHNNSAADSIHLHNVWNINVHGCNIFNPVGIGIIILVGVHCTVDCCNIYDGTTHGISIISSDYCEVTNNLIYDVGGNGIDLPQFTTYCLMMGNTINGCTGFGIDIGLANCTDNIVGRNFLLGNTAGCINDGGTDTRLPEITVYVAEPNGTIGRHPCVVLTDGEEVTVRFEIHIPSRFQEVVRSRVVVVPGASGDMNRGVETEWGKICAEVYNAASDSIAAGVVAITINVLECMDVDAALTGIAPGDDIALEFTRYGAAGTDTIDADCYILKFNMQYV